MIILALDGALGGFSAALDDGERIATRSGTTADALEHGLGRIAALLEERGLRVGDLHRLAVGVGPGSFTGVRIAVSYAKALAQASGVPLVGVSSYDALEPDDAPVPRLAVVHGRPGVICARLTAAGGETAACGPVEDVLGRLLTGPPGALAVGGNTEGVVSSIAERGWTVRALPLRAAVPAAAIAVLARRRGAVASPHAVAPEYGEAPAVSRPRS